MTRFLHIQIYNEAGTAIEYDNKTDENWGIAVGSASLDEILIEGELKFGQINSTKFEVQLIGFDVDLTGRKIVVKVDETTTQYSHLIDNDDNNIITNNNDYMVVGDGTETTLTITKFTGWIQSCKKDRSGVYRDLIAYDWLYYHRNDNVATWYNNFWRSHSTATIQTVRNSLLASLDIQKAQLSSLVNDAIVIKNTENFVPTSITLETVIQMLGILQNYCVHITGDGKLQLVKLPLSTTTPIDVSDNVEGENSFWENYTTNRITGIAVYDTSEDLVQLVGTDDNVYKITGNIFLLNQTSASIETICDYLLNELGNMLYVPTELSLIESNLDYKLGDFLHTDNGNTYIFKNSLSGSLFVNQKTTATANGANLSNDIERINETLIEGQKISKLEQNIDGIEAEVADLGRDLSTLISITAGKIVLKATSGTSVTEVTIGALNTVGQQSVFQVSAANIDITANEAINFLSGGNINLQGKNITLSTTNGNFGVTSAGALTCKTGDIGGWTITNTAISKKITVTESGNTVKYRTYLNAPTSPTSSNVAIAVSRTENDIVTYPFLVRYSGAMECTKGKIANFNITNNMLYGQYEKTESGVTTQYRAIVRTVIGDEDDTTFAFYIRQVETEGSSSTTTYPWYVRHNGTMVATRATIKGDINTTSLKIDNQGNLSIAQRSVEFTNFTINQMGIYSVSADAYNVNCLQISSGYGLYIPSRVDFGSSISCGGITCGRIYASGETLIDSNLFVSGWTYLKSAVYCGNNISASGNVSASGKVSATQLEAEGLELSQATPYIDFYYNSSTSDYTGRIIQSAAAYLDFKRSANTWLGLNALSFNTQSSRTVKKNIKNITEKEAKKLFQLRPVSFDYKEGATNQRGLIAEEVMEIYPEMVNTPEGGIPSIDYSKFVPYLIKVIQIQQKEIDSILSKNKV